MDLQKFKTQYKNILENKLNMKLQELIGYKNTNTNPFRLGTVEGRIKDTIEQLEKIKNIDNIKFESMDFWGYSKRTDKLLVSIITTDIKLYHESVRFDTFAKIIKDAQEFGYTKFIIKDDNLIDFYRVEDTLITYNVNGVDIEISEDIIKDSIIKNESSKSSSSSNSNYVVQHTRGGANMSYWNIGGVRVYD